MAAIRALRWLSSSVWLRIGAIKLAFFALIQWSVYAASGEWFNGKPIWRFLLLFYLAGASLELWLESDSAKATLAPIAARLDKSRIWRELKKPQIGNSPSLTVIRATPTIRARSMRA
jgi:hypothetical protein